MEWGARSNRLCAQVAAAAVSLALLFSVGDARAAHVSCGQVITTDTVLDADLDCRFRAPLEIGAPGIELDLNGHLLDGALSNAGFDDVRIANGTIAAQLTLDGVHRNRIADIELGEGFSQSDRSGSLHAPDTSDSEFVGVSGKPGGYSLFQFDGDSVRNRISDGSRLEVYANGTAHRLERMRDSIVYLYGTQHVLSHGQDILIRVIGHEHEVVRNRLSGLLFVQGNANRIADNTIRTDDVAIAVLNASSNVLERNRIVSQSTAINPAISLLGASATVVARNTISGPSEFGDDEANRPSAIWVQGGTGNTLSRNALSGRAHGVLLTGTVDNAVTGNVVKDVLDSGIYLYVSDSNVISGNRIARAGGNGISLALSADQNQILDNRSKRNVLDGIAVLAARGTGNLISGNDVRRNGDDGIDVDPTGNTLTRNDAHRNLDWGIEAVTGTIDGGGNRARHNGQPAQCLNIFCG